MKANAKEAARVAREGEEARAPTVVMVAGADGTPAGAAMRAADRAEVKAGT